MRKIFGQSAAGNGSSGLFDSLGLRGKIYGAMGCLCVLIALIAWLSLSIITENLTVSKKLVERGNSLAQRVEGVSATIKQNLTAQQERQVQSAKDRDELGQERLEKQVDLYEMLLTMESTLAAVGRNSNRMVINSEPYSIVAKDVDALRAATEKFFAMEALATIDETKVKGASRAVRAYLGNYDEVKALDAENVSVTQQIEKIKQALEIGITLRERMTSLVADIKQQATARISQENEEAEATLAQALAKDKETLASILKSQDEIRQNVADDVKANSSLEEHLQAKRRDMLIMTMVALGLGIAFSLVIVRMITRPMIRAVQIAHGIAEGDLEQEVDISGTDEIGHLGDSMRTMIDNLRANRDEIESNVRILDDVASTVSSSLEEISASMSEINSMTEINVQKARLTEEMSVQTKGNAEQGRLRMGEMVQTITEIKSASQEIAKTIKAINDIAFQTNLLALNAAVEAAHAGEQGLGFAVVAEEVRSLASRCSQAANDTTVLLEGPLKKIGHASEAAVKTSAALDAIYDNVKSMGGLIEDIVSASESQALGIKQINQGLTTIDSSAQGLAAQTDQLSASMDQYKKKKGGAGEQLQLSAR